MDRRCFLYTLTATTVSIRLWLLSSVSSLFVPCMFLFQVVKIMGVRGVIYLGFGSTGLVMGSIVDILLL